MSCVIKQYNPKLLLILDQCHVWDLEIELKKVLLNKKAIDKFVKAYQTVCVRNKDPVQSLSSKINKLFFK